ncbi:DUF4112 domain-containing protein [Halobacteriaceae bacterium SHR40]|uniref:DUF4112 domain-containing protein n=1 Tax=Halovenus amylolytica TaxID=2500550 RepID=UPI000FE31D64
MCADFESRFDVDYDGELPESVDKAALTRMETVAHILDESVRVPGVGFRIGVDPILGALPVAGDVVSAAFSLYIVAESAYLGVSFTTLLEMLANITIDVAGGSIPYVGTVIDALWKANKRNVELALEDLAEAVEPDRSSDTIDGGIDIPVEPED